MLTLLLSAMSQRRLGTFPDLALKTTPLSAVRARDGKRPPGQATSAGTGAAGHAGHLLAEHRAACCARATQSNSGRPFLMRALADSPTRIQQTIENNGGCSTAEDPNQPYS